LLFLIIGAGDDYQHWDKLIKKSILVALVFLELMDYPVTV